MMHDFGAIARKTVRGRGGAPLFDLYVGGGLGTTPHQAKLLYEDHPVEELLPAVAVDRPRLRAPRREAEPQPRPHQVPGQQAGHRGVPAPRGRGARRPSRTTSAGRPTCRTSTTSTSRRSARPSRCRTNGGRSPEGYDAWLQTNVYRQRQPGYAVATVALPLGDITAVQTRQLAEVARTVRRRRRPHHGRAEHRAALGRRGRPAGALRGAEGRSTSPRPAPGRSSTSPPARAPTPASWASPPRAAWPASCGTRLARQAVRAGRGGPRPADQGQRLLQLVRPAPRGRHRVLRQQPQDQRRHRAPLPGGARRPLARERRLVRPGDRRGAVEADPRGGRRRSRPASSPERAGRARASRTTSPRSARRSSGR